MKIDLEVKLNMGFLGEAWKECEIVFSPVSIAESRKMLDVSKDPKEMFDASLSLIKAKFTRGTVLSDGKVVEIKVDDIEHLPISVIDKAVSVLVSEISKKK